MGKRKLKTWVVDLESFTVEAYTRDEAEEKAAKHLETEHIGIDGILLLDD